MTKNLRFALAAAPLVLVLVLTGCTMGGGFSSEMPRMDRGGGATSSPARSDGQVNAADSMFVMMMIPHHEDAIEMSDLLLAKTGVEQAVMSLAQQIKDAQSAEIELMEGWLEDWGIPGPGTAGGMNGAHGMMSVDDMSALEDASGSDAARLYLEQMIDHHEGAIEMARDELDDGVNSDVRALAQRIIVSQTAEIATMRELLS